ncbi:hypothetical protein ACX93W_17085 [Paenibacillus sp. CAU 1782]
MPTHQNSSIPNVTVLVLFILIFPVGLLLILIRAILDRNKPFAAMKNHQFSSRLLFIFFALLSFSYFGQLLAGRDPIFIAYLFCIILIFLPALYMHRRAKQLKKRVDEEEMRRQLAEREWHENQQRMQWNVMHQQQQQPRNTAPTQPKTVTCTGCGARTTILPEESKNCEYCGFALSYPIS